LVSVAIIHQPSQVDFPATKLKLALFLISFAVLGFILKMQYYIQSKTFIPTPIGKMLTVMAYITALAYLVDDPAKEISMWLVIALSFSLILERIYFIIVGKLSPS
jgi:ABC-type transport system involved in cytochrome c biogenesis permease subunit